MVQAPVESQRRALPSAGTAGSAAGSARTAESDPLQCLHSTDPVMQQRDRKSTRLNSSHLVISYAVFCLKKKKAADFQSGFAQLLALLFGQQCRQLFFVLVKYFQAAAQHVCSLGLCPFALYRERLMDGDS